MADQDTNQEERKTARGRKSIFIRLPGAAGAFRCRCGGNVFHEDEGSWDGLHYRCNSCDALYQGEREGAAGATQPDPPKRTIIQCIEDLRDLTHRYIDRIADLESRFRHAYCRSLDSDACLRCGLEPHDPVHAECEDRPSKPDSGAVVGVCDFCGDGDVPVRDMGEMGHNIAGFSACEKCRAKGGKA